MKLISEIYAVALEHCQAGRLSESQQLCREILQQQPNHLESLHLCGTIAYQLGKFEEAIALYQQLLALNSNFASVYNNLGAVFKEQGRLQEAIAHYQQALKLNPNYPEAHNNLGTALQEQGKLQEAIAHYHQALNINPHFADAHNSLGVILKKQGKLEGAIAHYKKALQSRPKHPDVHNNLGNALKEQGKVDEAIAHFQQAITLQPQFSTSHSNLLLALHYWPNYHPEAIFAEHQAWAKQHTASLTGTIKPYFNERNPHRRLRIGYVSPDFCTHSVAFFIEPVLAAHNRDEFEVFCYANVAHPDETTKRLEQKVNCWRNIWGINDKQASELICNDGIDILVDLAGHTANNRMLLFARKPAPIQVTYLGYPNTTGLSTVDYRITDTYADPPHYTQRLHTERLIHLPSSFLCYQPVENAPTVNELPALHNGYITFGSFNNLAKITPKVIACWSAILQAVPKSRLILKYKGLADVGTQQQLLDLFKQNGISPQRLTLLGRISGYIEHLATYNRIDIALDTFPYNGTTTTCEALWMGLPVIVLAGSTHVSRVGVSLLSQLGMVDLIAHSPEEYVDLAVKLSNNLAYLQQLRANQRGKMAESTLTDARGFIHCLERAYREMWMHWCSLTK